MAHSLPDRNASQPPEQPNRSGAGMLHHRFNPLKPGRMCLQVDFENTVIDILSEHVDGTGSRVVAVKSTKSGRLEKPRALKAQMFPMVWVGQDFVRAQKHPT